MDKTPASQTSTRPKSTSDGVFFPTGYLAADERRAEGKALRGANGHDSHWRQPRDAKISAGIEDWDVSTLREFDRPAWALARGHARSRDPACIAGYLGSNSTFDDAVCEFAIEYADQNLRDYRAFTKAVREGRIPVASEGLNYVGQEGRLRRGFSPI
jgi:hypothetical protein